MGDPPLPSGTPLAAAVGPLCPRCHGAMSPGFLAVGGRANWVTEKGFFDASIFKGETLVGNYDLIATTAGHLAGWRCQLCGLLLIDYGRGPV